MNRHWTSLLVVAGGLMPAVWGQQYPPQGPQQDPRYQGDPTGGGQYAGEADYDPRGEEGYTDDDQGVYAPAPPPMPNYGYDRPPMPGPQYCWVDGYWSFGRGRYIWVAGYWTVPPYAGVTWVGPRYSGGRFYVGFWGGGRQGYNRGSVRINIRNEYRRPAYQSSYRAPARNEYRSSYRNERGGRGSAQNSRSGGRASNERRGQSTGRDQRGRR